MRVLANRSSIMDFHYLQRAKVYRLNDEGKWDDKGTGHVSVEYLERSDAVGLVVIDEEDNTTLLVHRISADDIYRRQEDMIISWTDPEVSTDLALSFQETMGCSYIWDQICNVQRNIHFPTVSGLDVGPISANENLDHSNTTRANDDTYPDGVSRDALELPLVELSSLPQIMKIVAEVSTSFLDRDRIASLITRDPKFLCKLVELFRACEDMENTEGLHMLYKIVKGIVSLNDGRIFDIIFSDDYIMDIVGALEYDPDLPSQQDHRAYLRERSIFKEAVPIREPSILSKIHQTYRIGYIKDVILPRVLDDQTFTTINAMILANNVAVMSALQDDNTFIKDLFARFRSLNMSKQARKDLVHFLQEFCSLSKSLQLLHRIQLFSTLIREGLFDIVTDTFQFPDESLHLSGADILIVVLSHDPGTLRKFLAQQKDHRLFSLLVTGMLTPGEGGLQAQLLEVMRMLLDCETMERQQPEKCPFLEVFYSKYMDQMMEVLGAACPVKGDSEQNRKISSSCGRREWPSNVTPEILGNICELMCFCVQHHAYRIKYYVMRNNVIEKVLRLIRRKEKYLVVAAVRFLRTCVGRKDEFYYQCIVKKDLFDPVIQVFLANGSRYNLLNSAVLELIDFIRKENLKTLITYIVDKYYDKLEKIDYVDTFLQLKLKHDQSQEGAAPSAPESGALSGGKDQVSVRLGDRSAESDALQDPRKRRDERALEKDEEHYFNEDSDDEEDTASAQVTVPSRQPVIVNGSALGYKTLRAGPLGLVDYEDEDEDSPMVPGSYSKDSKLVDRNSDNLRTMTSWPFTAEDKDMQNVKRKPVLPDETKDSDIIKRRKTYVNAKEQTERDLTKNSTERLLKRDEAGSSNSFDHDKSVEGPRVQIFNRSTLHSNDRAGECIRNAGDWHDVAGLERPEIVTNGSSTHKASGVERKKSTLTSELVRGGSPSPGAYSIR